jgi:hypothetical protein
MASHLIRRLSMINLKPEGAGLGRQALSPATSSGVGSSSEVTSATPRSPSATTWWSTNTMPTRPSGSPGTISLRQSGRVRSSGISERRAHQLKKSSSFVSGRPAGAKPRCSLTSKRGASIQALLRRAA